MSEWRQSTVAAGVVENLAVAALVGWSGLLFAVIFVCTLLWFLFCCLLRLPAHFQVPVAGCPVQRATAKRVHGGDRVPAVLLD